RPLPIIQYTDGLGHFCVTQTNACPGGPQAVVAKLYACITEGLTPLYRCHKGLSFFLTISTVCEQVPGYTLEGAIGACATTAACGALPLNRFYNPPTESLVYGFGTTAPPGFAAFGSACYAWAN